MSARRGGRSRNAGSVELERQVEGSEGAGSVLSYNPNINLTLAQQRQRLPVFKVSPRTSFQSAACEYCYHLWPNNCIGSIQYRSQILYLLEKYRTVVIIGETGSGKTTQVCSVFVTIYECILIILFQIPQYLHEANWTGNGYVVGITQPRRVAATTVSIHHHYYCNNKIFGVDYVGCSKSSRRTRRCVGT